MKISNNFHFLNFSSFFSFRQLKTALGKPKAVFKIKLFQ